jgi:hypothetical protein
MKGLAMLKKAPNPITRNDFGARGAGIAIAIIGL